jgi:O-antigen/teichoic acid export membrane protein
VAVLVMAMAPVLAWFYGEPRLAGITLVMSVGIFLSSLSMVHVGVLRRQMNFRALTMLEVVAMVVGLVVGVGSALAGAGYWALVFQQVSIYAAQASGAVLLCRWRPAARRASPSMRDTELRSMLRYGKDVSAARIVSYLGQNTDTVLVGYFAGPATLGLYQKAYQWSLMPISQLYSPLLPVAVSSFSRLQADVERYRLYVRATLLGLFSAVLPATLLLFLTAEPVILLLLGRQWVDAIPIFRILAVGAFFASFPLVMRWIFLAEGRTAEQLRWAVGSSLLTVVARAVGVQWSAVGVAIAFSIAMIILAVPGVWYGLRNSPLQWGDFLAATWRPVTASLAAAGGLILLRVWLPPIGRPIPQLAFDGVMFGLLYTAGWLFLPGGLGQAARMLQHARVLLPSR